MTKNIGSKLLMILILLLSACSVEDNSVKEKNQKENIKIDSIHNPEIIEYQEQALITMSYDDGLISNYEIALPIHEKYGMPGTFNILGKRAVKEGKHENFMTIDMIKDSYDRGIDIASHSYNHDDLTKKSEEELHYEMGESKKVLEAIVGKNNVVTIAMPYTKYNKQVKEIAKSYYKGVRLYEGKFNEIPVEDPYELYSPLELNNETEIEEVKERIDEAVKNNKWLIIMLHDVTEDKDERFGTTPEFLEEIFKYISKFDYDELLPINTKDALEFMDY